MKSSKVYKNQQLENKYIEGQLVKISNYLKTQKSLEKDKRQLQQIELEIIKFQQQARNKKREILNAKIEQTRRRESERKQFNKAANQEINFLKKMRKNYKEQLQKSIMKEQQQYKMCYEKALAERREIRRKIDFEEIKDHEKRYIQRIRTENQESEISHSKINERRADSNRQYKNNLLIKKEETAKLLKKSIQYGNKMQIQKRNVRSKTEAPEINAQYQKNLQKIRQQREFYLLKKKKPALIQRGSWQKGNINEIKKIKNMESLNVMQKIRQLRIFEDSYNERYNNGKTQSLNLLSEATLAKASLMLSISQNQK